MGKNIDVKKSREELKAEWARIAPFVDREYYRSEFGDKIAFISPDCPEKLKPLAERLAIIQNEKGEIKRGYLEKADVQKIKDMSKLKNKLNTREAINLMVENAYYVDNKVISARHILRFLKEFDEIYDEFYIRNGVIPLNAFSKETRLFIKDLHTGLLKEDVMRTILEVYKPEFANINMVHHDHGLIPLRPLKDEETSQIVADLKEISAENGSLDVIFASEYEGYLKSLCERLKYAGYNFHTFIAQHTDLKNKYTLCFKCKDIVPAVKKMCESYKRKYNTTKGIMYNDPYLYYKIELVKEILGVYTISEVLEKMGIDADNYDTTNMTLTEEEISQKEKVAFDALESIYPDKFINLKPTQNHIELYEELLYLARRRKFQDINDYLKSKGFSRDMNYNAKNNRNMFLSEKDIVYYEFLDGCESAEDVEAKLAELSVELADPYESIGVYRKLAFDGIDSSNKKESKVSVNKEMFRNM